MRQMKLILAAATGVIFVPCLALAATEMELTTLRTVGAPKGQFQSSSSGAMLGKTEVSVRNVGDVAATGVTVAVEVPGGKQASLSGPSTLNPNQTATYSADVSERIISTQKLKAVVACDNCR